jgi:uncharacterized protein (TIGR03032 family)
LESEPAPPAEVSQDTASQPIEGVARGNFVAVLDRLGLSLVLSTRPNHIVFVGAADGHLTCSASLIAQPIGLAAERGRIAVATARTIIVFANVERLAAHYPGKPDYYDAFFVPRALYFTGDCHMHDMVFSGGAIIGANTNFSCICRVDGGFSFTPLWRPSFISQLRAEDRCHLNGFAGEDNELRYVTALSASDTEGGWREAPDTGGILIDARTNAIMRSDLCMPHSPRIIDDELYMLNGGEGHVLRVDRATGASTVVAELPGFTHGLCAHGGVLFVGMSQNRASRKKNPPPLAQRLSSLVAGVAAIDLASGQILGALEFVAGVSEVYDLQPLPGIRRACMQNLLAIDGYVSVETPNSGFWMKRPDNDPQHLANIVSTGNYQVNMTVLSRDE